MIRVKFGVWGEGIQVSGVTVLVGGRTSLAGFTGWGLGLRVEG